MKLLYLFLLFFYIHCSSIDIAVDVEPARSKELGKLAVLDFEIKDSKSKHSEFSDLLAHQLIKETSFKIIERDKETISKILAEQSLSTTGIIEESSAVAIGKILGVESIMIGKIEFINDFRIPDKNCVNTFNAKFISVKTAHIFMNINKEPGIEWSLPISLKYILGLGLIWDKRDLLLETCKTSFLSKRAAQLVKDELIKQNSP